MEIESLSVIVNAKTPIELGENGAIKMDLISQFHLGQNEDGEIGIDADLAIDIENVSFLGMKIPVGYKEYQEFKPNVLKLGINVDELVEKEIEKIKNNDKKIELKLIFQRD